MKLHWLLPGFLSLFVLTSRAEAARLETWRFNVNQNRLEFTTDEGVQPRAQLIANPTRLVIDLPGTQLGRSTMSQIVGQAIQSVRVGQFDAQTTRIVIELAPGYTLDPQQVQVRGASPTQWTVSLPTPQAISTTAIAPSTPPVGTVSNSPELTSAATPGATQIQGIRETSDGFFIRTSGPQPEIEVRRSPNREQIEFTLKGTGLASTFTQRDISINRPGVSRLQFAPVQSSPPATRVTLSVAGSGSDWQATYSRMGSLMEGIVVIPTARTATAQTRSPIATTPATPVSTNSPATPPNPLATIQAVELDSSGSQLLIRSNQNILYTHGWDRASASYQITINSARLADQIQGPQLDSQSPLLRVRLLQQDPRTVRILLQPAAGVQVGSLNQPGTQVLALQLQRNRPPIVAPGTVGNIPIPPTNFPPPISTAPPLPPTRVPTGRRVVVVDPGHGGPDPGAIGIGGIQEKHIVLDISRQVAAILESQGVQAVMTRQDDRDLDLEPRVRLAQQVNASIFVSIHANSINLSRPDVNGLETYYFASGERLARTLHNSILQGVNVRDRGVRQARFYVLRRTAMPAVLLEVGFVTGAEDAPRLADPTFRSQMAAAIARGILQYIQQN